MRANKSRGTKTTEWRFRSLLVRSGIRGWRIGHESNLPGKPDVVFNRARVAIFLDGCFWHGCRDCRSVPVTNRAFWHSKINRNIARDRTVAHALRKLNWKVLRIWEHELATDCHAVLRRILTSGAVAQRLAHIVRVGRTASTNTRNHRATHGSSRFRSATKCSRLDAKNGHL